ncbi:MAG: adenylate/guanylate cyclase domain-containing protein, partial [Rhodospirillales bacterium]|nr:adenylate/guanylate cyclase domain-containing protein [Rhodospirillales bacterium]
MLNRITMFIFGQPAHQQLPERVRRSIVEQQVQAEKLIGWAQLALVVFFVLLYTIAPKTSDGTKFMPVPYVLAMYLMFTAFRLLLTYKWALPRWFLFGSVISDITLLMVLIWSFHLQYNQPAPFYLKAPTLLYVFIFISLRTLRFEPTFVIATGTAAAVGWFALLWYAMETMAGEPNLVTRDYVLYMTSNMVLVGAEIDKIISILLVTTVLAVAQIRARRLLTRAVADGAVAHDLSRFVTPDIAAHVASAERAIQPGDGEVKTASILFCDLEGFSGIAQRLSPGELMQTFNEYLGAVNEVIATHGGVITEFRGDAMLVTFNTAHSDPDHAANALRTALGIQDILKTRRFGQGIRLKARCGISTGDLITGTVGTAERLLFTVHGDEVNIAARLEKMNKEYGTYIL